MAVPEHIELGRLLREIARDARWQSEDEFPGSQEWADQVEKVLRFVEAEGELARYLSRLKARAAERQGALSEIHTAYFLHSLGFNITGWEPVVVPNRPGDLEISFKEHGSVFVEVKGPTWQGELARSEIHNGRTKQPKYITGDARFGNPAGRVMAAIDKALPKLGAAQGTLVVIADDLFVPLLDWPESAQSVMYGRIEKHLGRNGCSVVGGVLVLSPIVGANGFESRSHFIPNASAVSQCRLPLPVAKRLGQLAKAAGN